MKNIALSVCLFAAALPLRAADQPAPAPAIAPQAVTGKVIETMDSAGYTYVCVDTGKAATWAAAPQFSVKVGDSATVNGGMPMSNYHSKTLNRDFPVVIFTDSVTVNGVKPAAPPAPMADPQAFTGKVVETMNSGGYTYVCVNTGKAATWAAAPQFDVKVGDTVTVPGGAPMPNYHSKTLNRTFDSVLFTDGVKVASAPAAPGKMMELPKGHPPICPAGGAATNDFSGIKPALGGKTVAEINTDRAKLNGQAVSVRGKVVKYNEGVMGKNWLHIRDGSGAEGGNDLTVTTSTPTKVGATVLVTGKVTADRDFGSGYKYSVIIEDAKVVVE